LADVHKESWFDRLQTEAGTLWEELRVLRHPQSPAEDPHAQALEQILCADLPPWVGVTEEERASFAETHPGRSLDEVMRIASDPMTSILEENDRRNALLLLISWDHRFMFSPSATITLRIAQVAGDQAFFRALGDAVARNERYAGRGMRAQRLLSRLLVAFAFGDKNAYTDQGYRLLVRERLRHLFTIVEAPDDDPAWKILDDRDYFNKHLTRLGFTS